MKEWKKIPNYVGYEASTDGEIKTFNWKNKGKEAIMKPAPDACGYMRTMLKNVSGKFNTIKVHRIIAQTFIPNPENLPCVNHINGVKDDNRVENLEWCTVSDNLKHSYKLGLSCVKGERNPAATIKEADVIEIRKNYVYGKTNKERETKRQIADRYGVTFGVVKAIIQGRTWKHLL